MNPVIARIVRVFEAHNAINVRTVDIYFQSYPGAPSTKRGVQGLEYQVLADGILIQSGQTGDNGKVKVRVAPGVRTVLRILSSEYEVSLIGSFHPIEQMRGVQQRLAVLGYKIGHLHGDNRRADTYNNPDEDTERAILNFQADNDLTPDAMFGPKSEKALKKVMKNSKAE